MLKKTLMIASVLFMLVGCGSDGGDAEVVVASNTEFYDENTTTSIDFNNSVVIIPTVSIPFEGGDFDITDDNNVTLAEADTTINVSGYVSGDLAVGSDVSLVVGGNVYTSTVVDGGTWVIPVAGTVLHNTNTTTVTVSGIDVALNPISETATKVYTTE